MLFKGLLGTDLSGSLGGIVASHNKGGGYFRERVTPVNPATPFQEFVRQTLADLTNRWNNLLTEVQRGEWTNYAQNVPIINKVGEPQIIPALSMYVRSNVGRIQAGLDRIDDAPAVFNLGSFTAPTFAVDGSADTIDVTFEATDAWVDEDGAAMLVYTSRPVNPTVDFFKGPYRLAGAILGDSAMAPTSPATVDLAFPAAAGQRVYVKVGVVRGDGRSSDPFRGRGLAA